MRVHINGAAQTAICSDSSFEVDPGQLALAPGSSGWKLDDGKIIQWAELFLRSGRANELFDSPAIGATIQYAKA